jgi:polyisoprenoid-binding protein YceI
MTTTTRLSELTGDYVFDTARTRIGFVASAMGAKVRGQFGTFEGAAHLDGDDPSRSSVRITISAASIATGNQQRDGHLRGHFLDAGSHPAITFASTRVERLGEASFQVTGDLTIRGVTGPVTVDCELAAAGIGGVTLSGRARINRKDWGVNWTGALGTVSRQVTLDLEMAVTRDRHDGFHERTRS